MALRSQLLPLTLLYNSSTQAFRNRPEIAAQEYEYRASQRLQKAERDLLLPDIRVLGVVGGMLTGAPQIDSWCGAVGVNVNIPIFNGCLSPARAKEATLPSGRSRNGCVISKTASPMTSVLVV